MARGSSMAEMLLMANHRRKVALALNGETPSLAVHTEFAVPVGGRREHTIRVKTRLIPDVEVQLIQGSEVGQQGIDENHLRSPRTTPIRSAASRSCRDHRTHP